MRKELDEQDQGKRREGNHEQHAHAHQEPLARRTVLHALGVKPLQIVQQPVEHDTLVGRRATIRVKLLVDDGDVFQLQLLRFRQPPVQLCFQLLIADDEAEQLFDFVRVRP